MDFFKKLFKGRGDEYEAALRKAETKLAAYEKLIRKDLKTWQEVQSRRPNEIARTRDECKKRLLMVYSWSLLDILDTFYRSSALLMKRALLRSLVDEAAIAALSDQLFATQAWRRHLTLIADERAKAAAQGQPLPLPTANRNGASGSGTTYIGPGAVPSSRPGSAHGSSGSSSSGGSGGSIDDLLPLDVNAFCVPTEEVVRTAPAVKRLQKRVARISAALAESDASIRTLLPQLRTPSRDARRDALSALLSQEASAEVQDAAAEGEFADAVDAFKGALSAAAAEAVRDGAEDATASGNGLAAVQEHAARVVSSLQLHPSAPWLYTYLLHRGAVEPPAVLQTTVSAVTQGTQGLGSSGTASSAPQAEAAGTAGHRHASSAHAVDGQADSDVTAATRPVVPHLAPLHGPGRPPTHDGAGPGSGASTASGGIMASPPRAALRGKNAFDKALQNGSGLALGRSDSFSGLSSGRSTGGLPGHGGGEAGQMEAGDSLVGYAALDTLCSGVSSVSQPGKAVANPFDGPGHSGVGGGAVVAARSRSASYANTLAAGQGAVLSGPHAAILAEACSRPYPEQELASYLTRGLNSSSSTGQARVMPLAAGSTQGHDVAIAALLVYSPTRQLLTSMANILQASWQRVKDRELRSSAFKRLVADQRTGEGRLLQRWCDRVLAAGFEGIYAFDLPRFMGFDPGTSWLDKERIALNIKPPAAVMAQLARDGVRPAGSGSSAPGTPMYGAYTPNPSDSTGGDTTPRELVLADGIDGMGSAAVTAYGNGMGLAVTGPGGAVANVISPLRGPPPREAPSQAPALMSSPVPSGVSQASGVDYSALHSPPAVESHMVGGLGAAMGTAAAAGPAAPAGKTSGPTIRGGVPSPKLVHAFLTHFTRDLAQHTGLTSGSGVQAGGAGASSSASSAGQAAGISGASSSGALSPTSGSAPLTDAETLRVLRACVQATVYPRLHALIFAGVDIVPIDTNGSPTDGTAAGDGAGPGSPPIAGASSSSGVGAVGVVGASDLAAAAGTGSADVSVSSGSAYPSFAPPSRAGSMVDMRLAPVPTASQYIAGGAMAAVASVRSSVMSTSAGGGGASGQALPGSGPVLDTSGLTGRAPSGLVTSPQRPPGSAADVMLRRDRIWLRKQLYAASMSADQIGVPEHFLTPLPGETGDEGAAAGGGGYSSGSTAAYQPFSLACALLAGMDDLTQPSLLALHLTAAVDSVVAEGTARVQAHQAALARAKAQSGEAASSSGTAKPKPVHVTAEDLIPLLIYVCSRSGWRRPHACLAFAQNFAVPPGSAGGKEGYLVALLQSCIAWVCQRKVPAVVPATQGLTGVAAGGTSAGKQGQAPGTPSRSAQGAPGASPTASLAGTRQASGQAPVANVAPARPAAATTYDGPRINLNEFTGMAGDDATPSSRNGADGRPFVGRSAGHGRSGSVASVASAASATDLAVLAVAGRRGSDNAGGIEPRSTDAHEDLDHGHDNGYPDRPGGGAEGEGLVEYEYEAVAEQYDAELATRAARAAAEAAEAALDGIAAGATAGRRASITAGGAGGLASAAAAAAAGTALDDHTGVAAPADGDAEAGDADTAEFDREYEELLAEGNGDPLALPESDWSQLGGDGAGSASSGKGGTAAHTTGGLKALIAEQDAIEGALSIFG